MRPALSNRSKLVHLKVFPIEYKIKSMADLGGGLSFLNRDHRDTTMRDIVYDGPPNR